MAQELQNLAITAPGFKGVNTQDSPVNDDFSFASVAENCIIDKYGRIGARKGIKTVTSSLTPLGSSAGLESVGEFLDASGNNLIFGGGNNKIFKGTSTNTVLTEVSLPGGYSVSANNWKIVNFNNSAYFFQQGYEPLVYSNSAGLQKMSAVTSAAGTPPQANEVIGAYGRLWAADFATDKSTVYWSDLLGGHKWTGGSSGSINLSNVWPDGYDEIVALAGHNGFLVIFGTHSIIVYSGATSPASMTLEDTVSGVGCVSRDSVKSTGKDLIFLSSSGVVSLGRTIQEKSMPIVTVSATVTDDVVYYISLESDKKKIKAVYSPEESFYLLVFPTSGIIYCFDMRAALDSGASRATTWSSTTVLTGVRTIAGDLFFGGSAGLTQYDGYIDGTSSTYHMRYFSNELSFGDPSRLKILKEINLIMVGGQNVTATANWAYNFSNGFSQQSFTIADVTLAEYNVSEYNTAAEYSSGIIIADDFVKTTGQGKSVKVGVEAIINDNALSLQQMNIKALIGRMT